MSSRCQCGYTLIEVVVALAVLALVAATASECFSLSLTQGQRAENLVTATLDAATIRDRLGADIPLGQTIQGELDNSCQWQVQSVARQAPATAPEGGPRGFDNRITVHCGGGTVARQAVLDVFRIAKAPS